MPITEPLLRIEGITKQYGATLALNAVDFDLHAGEVHALMGENGAGKSTLMKILAGNTTRDAGHIYLDGNEIDIHSPKDAAAHGIAIIHQELNTVPAMTVAENLSLGREPTRAMGVLDRRRMLEDAREALSRIGSDIDPGRALGDLSVGMQQMVEIARATSEHARILVLDEPTAALSQGEANRLYELIDEMRNRGVGLIYISHRMEEVWALADRVTVFRDGARVGTRDKGEISPPDVVKMMVGRNLDDLYHREPVDQGAAVLHVDNLTDGQHIGPVSFEVHAGEVVCLAGLVGVGRTEVARLIFGADTAASGQVRINGEVVHATSPAAGIHHGIAMVPESRKDQALFLDHSVEQNVAVSSLDDFSRLSVLRLGAMRRAVLTQMKRLNLRQNAIDLPVRALSGGNQQKAVLGRWLLRDSRVLILDEPTRGVDIGAKSEIYDAINELARQGCAILVVSSDLPEVLGISDRILVMRGGRIVFETPTSSATEESIMAHATGTATKENNHE